jgi:hypothetical protein
MVEHLGLGSVTEGKQTPPETVEHLLTARANEYGKSWWIHGLVTAILAEELHIFNLEFPEAFWSWQAILDKLIRALFSPRKIDHWKDIEGYAHLVREYLESGKK